MVAFRRLTAALLSLASIDVSALGIGSSKLSISQQDKRAPLQDLVTWDEHSLFVRGERMMFYSGEFHPWRLPVPGLWLDVGTSMAVARALSGLSADVRIPRL